MSLSANMILDVRAAGNDANGGGFNPANANFAADGTVDTNTGNTSAPVFSSASYNFVAGDAGAWLYVKSGTNSIPGWYQIASVAANKATLTAGIGTAYLMINNTPVSFNTAAGIATVGTPTSLTWGVDYSQQDAAEIAYTDMLVGATTTQYTSALAPVGKNIIGNIINVTSGATVQRVEVVSTSAITATCDKSLGTAAQVGVGNLGGGLASPGMAGGIKIAGNDIFIGPGTYTIGSTTQNIATGKVVDSTGGVDATNPSWWVGYNTSRHLYNTDATRPTISAGAQTTFTILSFTGTYIRVRQLVLDGNAGASTTGFSSNANYQKFDRLKALNCTVIGIDVGSGNSVSATLCSATVCSGTAGIRVGGNVGVYQCEAYANTVAGFQIIGAGSRLTNCISSGNTGVGFDTNSVGFDCINCVSYGNTSNGFNASNSVGNMLFINCIAEANGAAGWSTGAVRGLVGLYNCAGYNNTGGNYTATNLLDVLNFIANTTGSFFINASGGNFALNLVPNQGALARAAGIPGVMPRGTSTGYIDIGALQSRSAPRASYHIGM